MTGSSLNDFFLTQSVIISIVYCNIELLEQVDPQLVDIDVSPYPEVRVTLSTEVYVRQNASITRLTILQVNLICLNQEMLLSIKNEERILHDRGTISRSPR
jgi:hypothetical protein